MALASLALVQCEHVRDSDSSPHTPPGDRSAAVCDFGDDGVADLGYIEPGSSHELVYVFKPQEGQALSGIEIESDCPCLEVVEILDQVEAGDPVRCRIRFNAPNKVLRYKQDLTVFGTASGQRADAWLTIDARLGLPLVVDAEEITLGPGEDRSTISLTNDGARPVKLIYALSSHPDVRVLVPNDPAEPGQTIELALETGASFLAGDEAMVRIKTTLDHQPELMVRVRTGRN